MQLNAVIDMAIGFGMYKTAEDEDEVIQRWAILKEQHPTT